MPKSDPNHKFHFEGFENPTTTPVPDVVFDVLMTELTEAELRVLLYIIRRTFGFKKDREAISLSQMVDGITTRDGRVLDRGTGMSRRGVMKGCAGLLEKGVIRVEKRLSELGDNEINIYSLRFRSDLVATDGVGNNVPYRRERSRQGVGNEMPPQQTVKQQTDFNPSKLRKGKSSENDVEENEIPEVVPHRSNGFEPVGSTLTSRRLPRRQTYDEDRERILAYLQDFARELGDQAPLKSSVTRAYNLYKESGKSIESFTDAMYQARAITKERSSSIQKRTGETSLAASPKNKAAYFFAVLTDVLGLKTEDNPADQLLSTS